MATPTDKAWEAALHMLNYLMCNKHEGIRFTEGADCVIAYVDASNKDDPVDGKTQYGYIIWFGGPRSHAFNGWAHGNYGRVGSVNPSRYQCRVVSARLVIWGVRSKVCIYYILYMA